jgi:hypothetical protein
VRDKLKDTVRKHFNEGEMREGFACLEALSADEFCTFLFKNNGWISEGNVSDYFWKTYLPVSGFFDEIMSGDQAINLLHHYFSKNHEVSEALLQRLARHHPELLIKTIRLNRAFVNANHDLSLVFLKDSSDEYLKYHFYVFYELGVQYYRLYNAFSRALHALAQPDLTDIVHHVALWFEEKRYATLQSDIPLRYDLQHCTESIGLFFDHYGQVHSQALSAYGYTHPKGKESQARVLDACFRADESNALHEQPEWLCLDAAAEYWYFVTGTFNTYCFDLNYEVTHEGQALTLSPKLMSLHHAWHRESAKLLHWYFHYRDLYEERIPTSGDNLKNDLQREADIRINIAYAIAKHFSVLESSARTVSTKDLILILNGFNSNAFGRFVYPLDLRYIQKPAKWLPAVKDVLEKGEAASLARFMSPADVQELFQDFPEFPDSEAFLKDVTALLSTDLNEAGRSDRFRPFVHLFAKPFVKANGTCISFNGIMGESNIMTGILINLLDKNNRWRSKIQKAETEKMEQELAKLFISDAGFKQVVFSKPYDEKTFGMDGDLDVLIHEAGVLLCLELKRSKFRVLLDEIWDELRLGILTASQQLDKAEELLKNSLLKLKENLLKELHIATDDFSQIRFHSFIVSTSFENDHRLIRNKHLKISLFELQEILKGYISRREKPALQDLITEIARDTFWESRLGSVIDKTPEEASYRFDMSRLAVHYF